VDKGSLLIHTCCAPCVGYVYELFAGSFDTSVFYYNPNISPRGEYAKRLGELERFASIKGFPLYVGRYNAREWTGLVKEFRFLGERSRRCRECYRMRLEESFVKAKELGIGAVTTSLSISPHKDAAAINRIGRELESAHGIRYIEGDFKKNDGYRKSVALSKVYGFYRQNYCGCIYSMLERDKNSSWSRKASQSIHSISS
jgi:predicted adenine nucleotide alpha hydrolase (AANH) superfamily ATPase